MLECEEPQRVQGHSTQSWSTGPDAEPRTFLRATALIWAYLLHHSARSISASSCTPDCHHMQSVSTIPTTLHLVWSMKVYPDGSVFRQSPGRGGPLVPRTPDGGHLICMKTREPAQADAASSKPVKNSEVDSHSPWCQPVPANVSRRSSGSTDKERPGMTPPQPSRRATPP